MLYNRLEIDELERAVYIDPANQAARAEMLNRVPELMDQECDALADAEQELEIVRKDHKEEIANMREEIDIGDKTISEINSELDTACEQIESLKRALAAADKRIAELTQCADLV